MSGIKDHLKEGNGHGEEHPDVDHLDVRGDRQALGEAKKAKKTIFVNTWTSYLNGHFIV